MKQSLEAKIGYVFKNRSYLRIALTHSSYTSEHGKGYTFNNERMEFIGDAFLDAIVGKKLFAIMPEAHEGVLSKTRAEIVCEKSLAEIGREIGIGTYLLLGHGEDNGGGRNKTSLIADALEAVIGAIILDGGYEEASQVVINLFANHIRLAVKGELYTDYKTELQEKLQEEIRGVKIEYRLVTEEGPDHNKKFVTAVLANDNELGRGLGKSKKEAEQAAAADALAKEEF